MFVHADSLDDGCCMEGDVCIVGGGPVGIQMARRLARQGIRVILAESGEERPNARIQDLNIGTISGRWTGALRDIRMRQIGGTMHLWGGNCRPLDPVDFLSRPWVPNSGWPISYADLQPYFEQAHAELRLGDFAYAPERPVLLRDAPPDAPFEEVWFKLSRCINGTGSRFLGEFGQQHGAELAAAENLTLLAGANVTQIFLTADRRSVESLYVLTFQGKEICLRARAFVFACGGIETARLLLASKEDMACGIGNEGDSIGRYFMEHPHGLAALMIAHEDELPALKNFSPGIRAGQDGVIQHRLHLRETTQFREGLLNAIFQLISLRMKPHENERYDTAFRQLEAEVEEPEHWHRFFVVFLAEQHPARDSRVTLGEATDFFGMPQADVCWQVSDLDHRTVRRGVDLLQRSIFSGPRFRMRHYIAETLEQWTVGHGAHHMGTVRMSESPREGGVDRNCRIHGLTNGFVAGSPVFATAGMANPMLTSLAIGLRLSSHIASNLMLLRPPETASLRRPQAVAAQMELA